MILLDTAALLYWTLSPTHLTAQATTAIAQAEQVLLSSISIWEIGLKASTGKLALPLPLRTYVETVKIANKVEITPVTELTWLMNVELAWGHKDPADRTIVATAILLDCPLVTSDQRIRSFYPKAIW
jgi:PIN domain nuclease of toxin-antitoxin system